MFIDNGNYQELCALVKERYQKNAEQIVNTLSLRISKFGDVFPRLSKYVLTQFHKNAGKRIDSYKLGLPLFVYANDDYKLENKELQT